MRLLVLRTYRWGNKQSMFICEYGLFGIGLWGLFIYFVYSKKKYREYADRISHNIKVSKDTGSWPIPYLWLTK
jgi:hypothetical protein